MEHETRESVWSIDWKLDQKQLICVEKVPITNNYSKCETENVSECGVASIFCEKQQKFTPSLILVSGMVPLKSKRLTILFVYRLKSHSW